MPQFLKSSLVVIAPFMYWLDGVLLANLRPTVNAIDMN